jgi:hypothetical protein
MMFDVGRRTLRTKRKNDPATVIFIEAQLQALVEVSLEALYLFVRVRQRVYTCS